MSQQKEMYYSDYLDLERILNAQHPRSAEVLPEPVHDELLFIITHQAFELWFKQVFHEFDYVIKNLNKDAIDDSAETLSRCVQRLRRVVGIFKIINQQFEILETMTPLDFLEFRALLTPASGFQSRQFRLLEAKLGLTMEQRHERGHYKNTDTHKGGLRPKDYEIITHVEHADSLLSGLKKWLERMPYFDSRYWEDHQPAFSGEMHNGNAFISDYLLRYAGGDTNSPRYHKFKELFIDKGTSSFTPGELTACLFINLYRNNPLLQKPYELIDSLIEIDEQISHWRYRHFLMVKKMIGFKAGTGGSAGADYLFGALSKNTVFGDLTGLATYYIERANLPVLSSRLKGRLTFK